MYLGTRRIRSAGRTSGSIEITLPPQLQVLEGVTCRLTVRDGPRPEIVLQTDVSAAQSLFQELWQKLRLGLGEVDDLGDFYSADFTLALFPFSHWQERPPLAYADALTVLHRRAGAGQSCGVPLPQRCGLAQGALNGSRSDEGPPRTAVAQAGQEGHSPEALVRLLAFLGVAAAYRLGLKDALALAFGDAVAYLITGTPAGLGTDFERGMAHRVFWGNGRSQQPQGSPFSDQIWQRAQPGFRRLFEQFRTWQENPEVYVDAQKKWYRALMVEMGGQASSVEDYVTAGPSPIREAAAPEEV